jgi:hypothetical protein
MTPDELRALLAGHPDSEFVEHQLLTRCPWIFESDDGFNTWCRAVTAPLGLAPESVRIVGSAATGFSLSPLKPGRPFRSMASEIPHSDIDIAFIDANLFQGAWNIILNFDRTRSLGVSLDTRNKIRIYIYWGTISQQSLPRNTEPARILLTATSVAGISPPLRGYRIRSRIYRRIDDLRAYHVDSLRQLRAQLGTI